MIEMRVSPGHWQNWQKNKFGKEYQKAAAGENQSFEETLTFGSAAIALPPPSAGEARISFSRLPCSRDSGMKDTSGYW